jgi:hypothetical protein
MKVKGPPDATKMKELILHVATACAKDEKCGAVKLDKILFYADFLAFLQRGRSITDQPYFAIKEGPAPQQFARIREAMIKDQEIAIQKTPIPGYANPFMRIVALRPPDYNKSGLSGEDIALVDAVIAKLWPFTGTELSQKAHDFKGWKAAFAKGPKTAIPYASVLFDPKGFWDIEAPALPPEQADYGQALWKRVAAA